MQVHTLELPPLSTNAYLLEDPASKEALLIDAPLGASEAVRPHLESSGCQLAAVLLTHGHFDHMLGAPAFNEQGVPVYAHPADTDLLERPQVQVDYFHLPLEARPVAVDHWLTGDDVLEFLGLSLEVRPVPGHCPGNVLFYLPTQQCAFVGDALFAGGIGRYDLPGGNLPELENSIRTQIYSLPGDTDIYPGHGPRTTVAHEREHNPFVPA